MAGYEDDGDLMHYGRTNQAASSIPWWNPRYWARKIWIAIVAVVIIVIIIAVAVGVTVSKKSNSNAYPTYTELNYTLQDTYSGETFFDQFNYFHDYDPAHGFVHYVNEGDAKHYNLTYATQTSAVIKVDTTVGPGSTPDASTGRFSVRIESKKTYNKGLFLFDVKHTPYGCTTWPALWLTDNSDWPKHGEIDVLESINAGDQGNQMTLHSDKGCSVGGTRKMTGKQLDTSCSVYDNSNAGCGVQNTDKASFGPAFNQKQGGVMAVEWRDEGIRMWQFGRDAIPSDVTAKKPTPDAWGTATADFPNTHCNVGSMFKNNTIVANIDLCGDLVEASYNSTGCGGKCSDYVATKPEAFVNAYWEFGAFEVYQSS